MLKKLISLLKEKKIKNYFGNEKTKMKELHTIFFENNEAISGSD